MQWRSFVFLFLFIPFVLQAQNTKGVQVDDVAVQKKPQKTYALIVGVSKYKNDETYPSLNFADDDARAFYSFLRSKDGGAIPDKQIDTLLNENATHMAFMQSLFNLKEQLDSGDRFYLFFSGHGDAYRSDLAFLLPYDAPSGKGQKDKNHYLMSIGVINIHNLKVVLSEMMDTKDIEVILITDACRTNEIPGGNEGRQNAYDVMFEKNMGEIQLISCSSNQVSFEGVEWGNGRGLFSYHLVNGMSGMADTDPPDGKVTLTELYDYTKKNVNRATYDENRGVYRQTPRYCCTTKDALVISRANSDRGFTVNQPGGGATSSGQGGMVAMAKGVDLGSMMKEVGFGKQWADYNKKLKEGKLIEQYGAGQLLDSFLVSELPDHLKRMLKFNYSASLMSQVSDVLNTYLSASTNNNNYTFDFFNNAYLALHEYKKYADSLYYDENDVKVNELFLQAHSYWNSHSSYELRRSLAQVDSAIELQPEAAYLYNLQGLLNQNLGNYKKGQISFRTGIKLAPNWLYPTHNLGLNFANQNQLDSAYSYMRKAINLDTNYQTSYNGMGYVKYLQGDIDSSIWYCKRGLTKDIKDLWLWNQLGNRYLELEDFTNASQSFHKARLIDTTNYEPYLGLLNVHIKNYLSSDSLTYYMLRMVRTDTTDPLVYSALGNTLLNNDLDSMSLQYFGASIALDSTNSGTWYSLGYAYEKQVMHAQAVYCYKKVAELEVENYGPWNRMGILYYYESMMESAIYCMLQALERKPDDIVVLNNLGFMYIEDKQYKMAIDPLEKALNIEPTYSSASYELARAYAGIKKRKQAIQYLTDAAKYDESITAAYLESEPVFNVLKRKRKYKRLLKSLSQ